MALPDLERTARRSSSKARIPAIPSPEELAKLSPREILISGIRTKRDETVPVRSIILDSAIIDPDHAKDLATSMAHVGQASRVTLRARLDNDTIVYDVADGYHRSSGLAQLEKLTGIPQHAEATVHYGMIDEELLDLQILSSSVKSVHFARMGQWLTKAFEESPFADSGLSVAQAFGFAARKGSTLPFQTSLTEAEATRLKDWVKSKCKLWKKSVTDMHTIIQIASYADPGLVAEVRDLSAKERAARADKPITPRCLQPIVEAFMGEKYYPIQRGFAKAVTERELSGVEVKRLVQKVKAGITSKTTEEEAYQIAKTTSVEIDNRNDPEIIEAELRGRTDHLSRNALTIANREQATVIVDLKTEINRLKSEALTREGAWYDNPGVGLTPEEHRVVKANAYLMLDALRQSGMNQAAIDFHLNNARAKLVDYMKRHRGTSNGTTDQSKGRTN